MKENFLKVGGLFLPITSPILVTFTRFLACTFRKVSSSSTLHRSYIFGIIIHLLMDKWFPWLALNFVPKYTSWGLNGTKYWRFFIVEYLQSYILSFLVFFAGKQYIKTLPKTSRKVKRTIGTLSGITIYNLNHS